MKTVQINDLKARLAYWLGKVGRGEALQITKHNKPCAWLTPIAAEQVDGLWRGSRVGGDALTPVVKRVPAQWLATLLDDRDE